jgi:Domain of unknown function (DUF4419)
MLTMGITFAVDDVAPAPSPLSARDLPLASLATGRILGASPATLSLVEPGGSPRRRTHGSPPEDRMNALVQAVDLAFNKHRPLRLTPDVVWITLAQGFSIHVRENAEALRARFVRHEGREKVPVTVVDVPAGEAWRDFIARLSDATVEHLGAGVVALLTRPFSTTTDDARAVFRVALLDTFTPFFEYELVCICGIPTVTLEGSPDDWRDLRRRVEVMAEYDLRWWTDGLLPLCDQWIAAAEGSPDVAFWRAIHRPVDVYGGCIITGWLARLFPYCVTDDNRWVRSELTTVRRIPEDAIKPAGMFEAWNRVALRRAAAAEGRGEVVPWAVLGVSPGALPASWSRFEVAGRQLAEGKTFRVSGGLVGVTQDADGTLTPAIAWLAEEDEEAAIWAAFEARHEVVRRDPNAPMSARHDPVVRASRGALLSFARRYEWATLYHGAATLGLSVAPFKEVADGDRVRGVDGVARPVWYRQDMHLVGAIRGGGALGHVTSHPVDGVVAHDLRDDLDWVVYVPDLDAPDLRDCVVLAFRAQDFFRDLATRDEPWFTEPGASLGRLFDVLRNPPPSERDEYGG